VKHGFAARIVWMVVRSLELKDKDLAPRMRLPEEDEVVDHDNGSHISGRIN